MKILWCVNCLDWVKVIPDRRRSCECGRTSGLYIDNETIFIKGPCIPFGINNPSWHYAQQGKLATFEGWFYHTGHISTTHIHREDHYDTEGVVRLGIRLEYARDKAENREAVGEST